MPMRGALDLVMQQQVHQTRAVQCQEFHLLDSPSWGLLPACQPSSPAKRWAFKYM